MPDWLLNVTQKAHTTLAGNPRGNTAREYLISRGVTDADINQYNIGYAPSDFIIDQCTEDFNNWSKAFLRDKLVFPLYSPTGEVIGIQVRAVVDPETGPKYQQFYCYPQEVFPYLFGMQVALPHIFRTQQVVLVEGVFDYFAIKQLAPNALAILTAGIPVSAKKFLRRFCTSVVMITDMDESGRESIERLRRDCPHLMVHAPIYTAKDPAELRSLGRMRELVGVLSLSRQSFSCLS